MAGVRSTRGTKTLTAWRGATKEASPPGMWGPSACLARVRVRVRVRVRLGLWCYGVMVLWCYGVKVGVRVRVSQAWG